MSESIPYYHPIQPILTLYCKTWIFYFVLAINASRSGVYSQQKRAAILLSPWPPFRVSLIIQGYSIVDMDVYSLFTKQLDAIQRESEE